MRSVRESGNIARCSRFVYQFLRMGRFGHSPHRLFFSAGLVSIVLCMAWWVLYLWARIGGVFIFPGSGIPHLWGHALLMIYTVFPFFFFGFLLTVFPRWQNTPPVAPRGVIVSFLLLSSGWLLFLFGLVANDTAAVAGIGLMLAGWLIILFLLGRVLLFAESLVVHASVSYTGLLFGWIGLLLAGIWLAGGPWQVVYRSVQIGLWGLLLPVLLAVTHRMVPFFTQGVVPQYALYRPNWYLLSSVMVCGAHLVLESKHLYQWLAPIDTAFSLIALFVLWRWSGWRGRNNRLLVSLHIAYLWLVIAFVLYAVQNVNFAMYGELVIARAPLHALSVGFAGSMAVAMVTRVSLGHSGRPLVMPGVAWSAFWAVQVAAILRIIAELSWFGGVSLQLQLGSALLWVFGLLPWVVQTLGYSLRPRVDGKPG